MRGSIFQTAAFKKRPSTDLIVVHHSATELKEDFNVFDVHRWHVSRGFTGIGYHFLIEKDGVLRTGRPLDTWGAHCKGFNKTSVGVCVMGGMKDGGVANTVTDRQAATLQSLLSTLTTQYPDAKVVKHKDLANTLCSDISLKVLNSDIR